MKKLPFWFVFGAIFGIIFLALQHFSFYLPGNFGKVALLIAYFPVSLFIFLLSPLTFIINKKAMVVAFFIIMFMIYFVVGALIGRVVQQYTNRDRKKRKWKNIPMWIRIVFVVYALLLILQFIVWAGFGFQSAGP